MQAWRNSFLSLSTIGLGALILFLLNFVFGVEYFLDSSLQNLEKRADFSIPLQQNFDAFEYESLLNELIGYEVETNFLPAESLGSEDDPTGAFALPPRLRVTFFNLEQVSEVLDVFKKSRYLEVVGEWDGSGEREFAQVIDRLVMIRENMEKTTQVLMIIFIVGGILLAINMFRTTLFSRREEVFVARLVGARPAFIMGPFLFEGILLGMLSTIVAVVAFTFILREITVLPGGDIFEYMFMNVFGWELLGAVIIGVIGAWIAVQRYLFGSFEK